MVFVLFLETVEKLPFFEWLGSTGPVNRAYALLLSGGAALLVGFAPSVAAADPSSLPLAGIYETGEVQHPRSVAMGGAQVATGASTSSLYVNPANLPTTRVYHFEGIGAVGVEARRYSTGVAIADSSTNKLAGGFAIQWNFFDKQGINRTSTDIRAALAYPLGDKVFVGATGRYLRVGQPTSRGPFGASLASDGAADKPIWNAITVDAGITVLPTEGLRLGLVGRSLSIPNNALTPTQVILGAGYGDEKFNVEADGQVDFSTFGRAKIRAMAGFEYFVADRVPIRLGYRFDQGMESHAISAGVGYVDRRWSIDGAIRRDVSAPVPSTVLALGLRFFYDAAGPSTAEQAAGGADGN